MWKIAKTSVGNGLKPRLYSRALEILDFWQSSLIWSLASLVRVSTAADNRIMTTKTMTKATCAQLPPNISSFRLNFPVLLSLKDLSALPRICIIIFAVAMRNAGVRFSCVARSSVHPRVANDELNAFATKLLNWFSRRGSKLIRENSAALWRHLVALRKISKKKQCRLIRWKSLAIFRIF